MSEDDSEAVEGGFVRQYTVSKLGMVLQRVIYEACAEAEQAGVPTREITGILVNLVALAISRQDDPEVHAAGWSAALSRRVAAIRGGKPDRRLQ